MNNTNRADTIRYFSQTISFFQNQALELASDDRTDEAVFARVQMNVYDIFRTVFSVALKTAGEDDDQAVQFFMNKLNQIPQSWHTSLSDAERHGDTDKAHIERLKLEAVSQIRKKFEEIWEVHT